MYDLVNYPITGYSLLQYLMSNHGFLFHIFNYIVIFILNVTIVGSEQLAVNKKVNFTLCHPTVGILSVGKVISHQYCICDIIQ